MVKERRRKRKRRFTIEKPKKWMTPYLIFVKYNRPKIGEEFKGYTFKQLMEIVS